MSLSDFVSVDKRKNSKEVSFNIKVDGKWKLFSQMNFDGSDTPALIKNGVGKMNFSIELNTFSHTYFRLKTEESEFVFAEKYLPLTGGYNFRDLGGFKTTENRYVKWGKVFRSDDLNNLTESDLNYLSSIPLKTIVDFRSEDEISKAPDKLALSVKQYCKYCISPGNLMKELEGRMNDLSPHHLEKIMKDLNRTLVTDSVSIQQYHNLFSLLQSVNNLPLLFHCSAGKDRTGLGAALFLYSLGVDTYTILEDYLLSNIYLGDKYISYIHKNPNLKLLFEVKPEYLNAGLSAIKEHHKSIENFLTTILNVDLDKMRMLYLY